MTDVQAVHGELRSDDDRCAVLLRRLYDFTPEELWSALTDPQRLRRWLADAPRFEGGVGGRVTIAFDDGTTEGRILTWDEPRVLEYEWRFPGEDDSIVRFELRPEGKGTKLVLDQEGVTDDQVAHLDGGWNKMYWEPLRKFLES